MERTTRYNQLRRRIDGISDKILTQTLQKLEREGLILRVVHPVIPPHVDYSLTPLGQTLVELLINWAQVHSDELGSTAASTATVRANEAQSALKG